MLGAIIVIVVGVICIFFGMQHMHGNLSSLHSYHYKRVREEDKLPFGRIVGAGTSVIGAGLILNGIFLLLALYTPWTGAAVVSNVVMIVGFVLGLALTFYGMFKYNKGIF